MRRRKAKGLKCTQLVTLTPGGKVVVIVAKSMKQRLQELLEKWINMPRKGDYGYIRCDEMMGKALIEEVYNKYYRMLHLIGESKMQLTTAQAFALLEVLHEEAHESDPILGGLFMHLHQKLISIAR